MTDTNKPEPDNPTPPLGLPAQQPPPHAGGPQGQPPVRKGQIRQQQPGMSQPRQPSLADQRARAAAQQAQRERLAAETAAWEKKRKTRKRLLIGGGVTVGVVGLVAIWYAAASPDNVTAQCTDQNNVIVDDDYCDESYYRSHGGHSSNGFIYIGGSSYRYNYGGSGTLGQKVSGGSYQLPKGANVSTKSGTTVQRGGFGLGGSSKSGGS